MLRKRKRGRILLTCSSSHPSPPAAKLQTGADTAIYAPAGLDPGSRLGGNHQSAQRGPSSPTAAAAAPAAATLIRNRTARGSDHRGLPDRTLLAVHRSEGRLERRRCQQ